MLVKKLTDVIHLGQVSLLPPYDI